MTAVLTAIALLLGTAAGWLHFRTLRQVADRLLAGDLRAVAWQVGRFAGLGVFLFLCAKAGAAPLIGAGAGIMVGRHFALRRA